MFKVARGAKAKTGDWRDATLVRGTDVWLRTQMFEHLPGYADAEESEANETLIVDALRRSGHLVYPKRVGTVPFT